MGIGRERVVMSVVGVSGSLSTVSRTTTLVEIVAAKIADQLRKRHTLIHVADLGAELGGATHPKALPQRIAAAYSSLYAADIVVVGTPVYKGSYTGLLKHFFDLVDQRDFNKKNWHEKIVVLTANGGSNRHALVIEHQLRPLFGVFGALTVPTGIYLQDSDFTKHDNGSYTLNSPDAQERIDLAVAESVRLAGLFHGADR
jgi:FMN reductase